MGSLVEGKRVNIEGIKPDDRIVVKGLQRAIPGSKVDPQTADTAATDAKSDNETTGSEPKSESETSDPETKESNPS